MRSRPYDQRADIHEAFLSLGCALVLPAVAAADSSNTAEVAVDDTAPTSLGKGISYFNGITQRLIKLEGSSSQLFPECFAVQVLEDEEWDSFVITNVVKGADVGMDERSDRAGFVFETQPQLMVARKI